jgi:hypothetical protein
MKSIYAIKDVKASTARATGYRLRTQASKSAFNGNNAGNRMSE